MKYYITSLEMASGINQIKAKLEGCDDTTLFWWVTITHPTTGQVALCVPDSESTQVTQVTIEEGTEVITQTARTLYETPTLKMTTDDLVTQETLESSGWFVTHSSSLT
jgi:hypothetical protein